MEANKWNTPGNTHQYAGSDGHYRAGQLEEDLHKALDLLETVKNSIPQNPASDTKQLIDNFLTQFKKT